jgi:hypothetical protein
MTRALPIQTDTAPEATPLTGVVQIYDPAMCCPTGLCGAGVDPALLVLARDLRWLESQGVTVERFGLAQNPEVFVAQKQVAGLMQAFGDRGLPAALVNGEVVSFGKYPSRDELTTALIAPKAAANASPASETGCCTPGSACCT